MKKILAGITLCSILLIMGCFPNSDKKETDEISDGLIELIDNGSVDNGLEKWDLYINTPGVGKISAIDNEIHYKITKVGKENWHIQGNYAGLPFYKGQTYYLSVDLASTIPRPMQLRIQLDTAPYTAYLEENIMLTKNMQTFKYEFEMVEKTDEFAKLCFNIGYFEDGTTEEHTIRVDNLSIKTFDNSNKISEDVNISINQVGYLPKSSKIIRSNSTANNFMVKEVSSDKIVFEGNFSKVIDDSASGDIVAKGDFSSLETKGLYYIEIPEVGKSVNFGISDNIYKPLQDSVQKLFYYQRCGEELLTDYATIWAHGPCHIEHALIFGTKDKLEVSGGWHDAGDYGRYVAPGAKAVADLILANIIYPNKTSSTNIGIPKNNKFKNNLISEIKYELDWLLKMQDTTSGGVYHKVTTANFIGSVMPDKNSDQLILSPISPTATADFAAIMAMSSRFYAEIDSNYSQKALEAAIKAWKWLEKNPNAPGFKNPDGIQTGEYGDDTTDDEKFWAAIELYLATGNQLYHSYAKESFSNETWDGLGWQNVGTYGVISYLFNNSGKIDSEFYAQLEEAFLLSVMRISDASSIDGYGISLGTDYAWGSNELIADNGMRLLLGNKITGNDLYFKQAKEHLDYLLGVNSLGISFVTGFGEKSTMNPHHRPTNAAGKVVPGMLAGGPNKNLQDPLAKNILADKAPAKSYIDAEPSYSTNEITIYWNSPLYFLISAFVE